MKYRGKKKDQQANNNGGAGVREINWKWRLFLSIILLLCGLCFGFLLFFVISDKCITSPVELAPSLDEPRSSADLPKFLPEEQHVETEMAKFEDLNIAIDSSLQLNIRKCWRFDLFSVLVKRVNATHVNLRFGALISQNPHLFRASITVQVYNASGDHFVSDIDVVFVANDSWYITKPSLLNKVFDPEPDFNLTLRIVSVEVGFNEVLPYHFSMCNFRRRQKTAWNTFPFYVRGGYKFIIFVSGEPWRLEAYRVRNMYDDFISEEMPPRKIAIKIRRNDGSYAPKKYLYIEGNATKRVKNEMEFYYRMKFQSSQVGTQSRFKGTRSQYGVLAIPDLYDNYVDEDCFIFDVTQ